MTLKLNEIQDFIDADSNALKEWMIFNDHPAIKEFLKSNEVITSDTINWTYIAHMAPATPDNWKVPFIKAVRQEYDLGLKEAKDVVEERFNHSTIKEFMANLGYHGW